MLLVSNLANRSIDVSDLTGLPGGQPVYPWTDETGPLQASGRVYHLVPQAILSDFDISRDGSLKLGFVDRNALQYSEWNYCPDPAETSIAVADVLSAGEILHACNTSGNPDDPTWILEGSAAPCDATANFTNTGAGNLSVADPASKTANH